MSTTAKVLLSLGGVALVCLLLCCGGMGLVGYWGYNLARNAVSDDPAEIKRVTEEIVAVQIPPGFEPRTSMDFKIPVQNGVVQIVLYHDPNCNGTLNLSQISDKAGGRPDQHIRMGKDLNRQQQLEPLDIVVEKTELFESTINGQPAEFSIGEGKARGLDEHYWNVTGNFAGKAGKGLFSFQAQTDKFSREQLLEMLRSMH